MAVSKKRRRKSKRARVTKRRPAAKRMSEWSTDYQEEPGQDHKVWPFRGDNEYRRRKK